jgi:CPA2 family monovalent cation:H+ antiporter-2
MHGSSVLVQLVVVLGTAAVTTVVFQAARLPVALGYVLAGLLIGPHVPVPLVAEVALVSVLSELGVILLMFSIGLELRLGALGKVGGSAGLTAVIEVGTMVTVGWLAGRALGWSSTEALFAGACVGISSTMLVAKAFEELKLEGGFTRLVFAILVFEDLLAILLLAVLTGVASGAGLTPGQLAGTIAQLAAFLVATLVGGLIIVPRTIRLIARLGRPETLLISSLTVCFGMAALAHTAEYSVALGAFIGGMLVAESGHGHEVGESVRPFRDVFAAIFFVSIGMTIVPGALLDEWPSILVLTAVVAIGKPIGVTVGAFLAGNGLRPAIRAGLSLAQVGELSFVMATIGIAGGAVRDALLPVVVGVSCLTAFATPWLIKRSEKIAAQIARGLPRRIATFVSFYDGWLGRLRARPTVASNASLVRRVRRPLIVLAVDATLVAVVVIGAAATHRRVVIWLAEQTGLTTRVALGIWVGVAACIAVLFLVGVIRRAAVLAQLLALEIIPKVAAVDLGQAPRRALVLTFEVAIALAVGFPLAAVTQPFVPGGAVVVLLALVVLVIAARRSIVDLDGHVRAGSDLIVEMLGTKTSAANPAPLASVGEMMPGMGDLAAVTLPTGGSAVGQSLAQLDLRARTGATVLAIRRGETGLPAPSPKEPLFAGDVLALAGSDDEIAAARELLQRPAEPAPTEPAPAEPAATPAS